jgi:hypothetical protein
MQATNQINQSVNGNASYSLTNLSWVLVGSLRWNHFHLAVATALRDSGLYTGYGKIKTGNVSVSIVRASRNPFVVV